MLITTADYIRHTLTHRSLWLCTSTLSVQACRSRSPKLGTGTKIAPDSTYSQLPSLNSSNFKRYCIILIINLFLHSGLQDPFLFCILEKRNVQKFHKWKIKVCKDKSIQWLNLWLNNVLFWGLCLVFP